MDDMDGQDGILRKKRRKKASEDIWIRTKLGSCIKVKDWRHLYIKTIRGTIIDKKWSKYK